MGATGADPFFSFFSLGGGGEGKSFFFQVLTGGRGGEGAWKWVRIFVVPFRGQNQRSGTFYGVSNFSGLPET